MSLAHAMLALLVDCPQSGYDLTKTFEESIGCFWKATHQQIYRELGKLETQGWVHPEIIPQEGRPDKKLYTITEAGKQHLAEWISQPCDTMSIKEELLVKVFVGTLAPLSVIQQQLEQHRQLHLEKLTDYQQIEAEEFKDLENLSIEQNLHYLVLRRGIRYETDWVEWCDEAIALLKRFKNNPVC
ncbi:PadR family transcriptional regulator [Kovacikia minuta CCNUW1]|uniref:PadR family transcriptional regulator n=1 Tax=Kovacikia minuta TaxID=2931930 RepID=UPI001CC93775|nr:PadR family transcriptional regulator [Kovacikia minuta]UBF23558.1 PadR family transcriptional regulator [Kovacikia minuta CCNUW1]